MKVNVRYTERSDRPNKYLVEPNGALTVRQIIEQFSRGEVTAKTFEPSDDITDQNYTDDQLLNVVDGMDYFEAHQAMQDINEQLKEQENERKSRKKSEKEVSGNSEERTGETITGTSETTGQTET